MLGAERGGNCGFWWPQGRCARVVRVSRLVAAILICAFVVSGCYSSTEYDKYPKGRFAAEGSLVGKWKAGHALLALEKSGSFIATELKLEYFECSSGGVREKSGDGKWSASEGRQSTEVVVKFQDGCSATLWAGESDGADVLWSNYSDRQQVLVLGAADG